VNVGEEGLAGPLGHSRLGSIVLPHPPLVDERAALLFLYASEVVQGKILPEDLLFSH